MNIRKFISVSVISLLLLSSGFKIGLIFAEVLSKTIKVRLFFPRDGDQNPSADPNWYYYWSQTNASIGKHQYNSGLSVDGQYDCGKTYFEIGSSARLQDAGSYVDGEGIDNFGSTCLHENAHMDYFVKTWGSWALYLARQPMYDVDMDKLKDEDEPGLGYDPTSKGTSTNKYDTIDDFEDYACKAESKWSNNSVDSVDWAFPGHQYK